MTTLPVLALALAVALGPASPPRAGRPDDEAPRIPIVGLGEPAFRMPSLALTLAYWGPSLDEVKATPDQRAKLLGLFRENRQKARARLGGDRSRSQAEVQRLFDALREAAVGEILAVLDPAQRERLEQLRLRVQGGSAFTFPDLPARLGLSPEQSERIRAIVDEGAGRAARVGTIVPTWKLDPPPDTLDELKRRLDTPEFRAVKAEAWRKFFEARAETLARVEAALTGPQKDAYRAMLGPPYDPAAFWSPDRDDPSLNGDVMTVARALGLAERLVPQGGGQRADPNFNTMVEKPAYAGDRHPRVLFDEAHHNFHTASGRYKAFADLVANDGYVVTPNKQPFSAATLAGSDVLVIANALGAEGMGNEDAARSAFTDAECDAVRDWVDAGGALLLITDHQPFGDAADALARRFGVDMSKGVATDAANQQERGLLFARDKGTIGDHAITRGRDATERVDRVLTFAGQSLKGPEGSVPFLKFSETAVDRGARGEASAAGRAQGIAFARGKGRVVVMGEAAQLSAQIAGAGFPMGMNVPGSDNRKMALNTMHWLSRLID